MVICINGNRLSNVGRFCSTTRRTLPGLCRSVFSSSLVLPQCQFSRNGLQSLAVAIFIAKLALRVIGRLYSALCGSNSLRQKDAAVGQRPVLQALRYPVLAHLLTFARRCLRMRLLPSLRGPSAPEIIFTSSCGAAHFTLKTVVKVLDARSTSYSPIARLGLMFSCFGSTALEPAPSGVDVTVLNGIDVGPKDITMTMCMVVHAVLDVDKLKSGLFAAIEHKLPRAGARLALRNGVSRWRRTPV